MNWTGGARWRIQRRQKQRPHRPSAYPSARNERSDTDFLQDLMSKYVPVEKQHRIVLEEPSGLQTEMTVIPAEIGDNHSMTLSRITRSKVLTVEFDENSKSESVAPSNTTRMMQTVATAHTIPSLEDPSSVSPPSITLEDSMSSHSSTLSIITAIDRCNARIDRLEETLSNLVQLIMNRSDQSPCE